MAPNNTIQQTALGFIKANRKLVVETFVESKLQAQNKPITILMAGSPGAGKTEFSKVYLQANKIHAVRIDADEIKELIPQYNGQNSHQVQGASSIGVEYLYDFVLKKKFHALLDGTFSNYEKARSNIIRALRKGRLVEIVYIYQAPIVAWRFTKAREKIEGRRITKQAFVDGLFRAYENVQKAKNEFGDSIKLHVIVKNYSTGKHKSYADVESIEKIVKIPYTYSALIKKL